MQSIVPNAFGNHFFDFRLMGIWLSLFSPLRPYIVIRLALSVGAGTGDGMDGIAKTHTSALVVILTTETTGGTCTPLTFTAITPRPV